MIDIVNYEERQIQIIGLANRVADELLRALAARGRATLVVPGGTTSPDFLRELSTKRLVWEKIDTFVCADQFVPESDARSNVGMVRRELLQNHAAKCNLHSFWSAYNSAQDQALKLGRSIEQHLPIDVCVLGMGLDMHTASLLPGAKDLQTALRDEERRNVVCIEAANCATPRLTLTAPSLRRARNLHLLITGRAKRMALGRALKINSVKQAPIKAVMQVDNPLNVHFAA
ncbi:6-phosphogluconolactonase [Amylibacter marinus]|uniref:6-phosphogluconolactonase n=1 Tax=Amylibacter marinus TaxID=1475483 RepID=A0ABQ5VS95_9RHOB|nr:6-phosphogluconolactonase [Amylibacter marinus]GLQ34295.1 6-phosphogluconolactonase [Amylibacter marinus]